MFVYRDDYYLSQRQPKPTGFEGRDESDRQSKFDEAHAQWLRAMEEAHNKADLIIAKQRHGPTGTIPLFFEAEFTRFGDLDQTHETHGGY
jgi:replicative DNA helicase